VPARRREEHADGALELAEVAGLERERPVDPLPADHPPHLAGQLVVLAQRAVALRLPPHRGLAVGEPRAAHVEVEAGERVVLRPHAAADPVARLQHRHGMPARLQLPRGDEPGEPGADDDDVAQRAAAATRSRASSRLSPRLPQRARSA
jgi:hypothetical protein